VTGSEPFLEELRTTVDRFDASIRIEPTMKAFNVGFSLTLTGLQIADPGGSPPGRPPGRA